MAADGNWNLTISTPLGERRGNAVGQVATAIRSPAARAPRGNTAQIFDGTVNGDAP